MKDWKAEYEKLRDTHHYLLKKQEQQILDAFERGKAFGFAEGMKSMRLKELTDEEIMEVYMSIWNQPMEMEDIEKADITFARAILRKAQEKC